MRAALSSVVHFFVLLFIFATGGFFISLPSVPHVRIRFIQWVSHDSSHFYLIGAVAICLGILFLFLFYSMHKGQHYILKMSRHQTEIDTGLIQDYVEKYWKALLPQNTPIAVTLTPKQEIQITAEMPEISPPLQKQILEKAEKELAEILAKKLGYQKDFFFKVLINK